MKDITPKVVFNPKGQKNNSQEYLIYFLVRLPGSKPPKRLYNSDIKIHQRFWTNKEFRWVSEKHPVGSSYNARINKVLAGFLRYQAQKKLVNIPLNWELIDKFFKVGELGSFNDFVEVYIKSYKFNTTGTRDKYITFKNHLNEFNSDLSFNDINHSFFNQFKDFLIKKKKNRGNTVEKNFDPLRVIIKSALLEGYFSVDPFINYRLNVDLSPSEKSQIYLTDEEMIKIRDLKIPEHKPGLIRVHKMFMFCYYCSIRLSDLRLLEWVNIKETKYGLFIEARRFKRGKNRPQGEIYLVPIYKFKNGLHILENQRQLTKGIGKIFPNQISDDKYRLHVKKLTVLAEIEKDICNTTARKSSLQSWYLHGANDWLKKVSGHRHNDMLHNHYIQTSIEEIASRCEKIDQKRFDI